AVWPPHDARPVDVSDCYAGLAESGFVYGPAFRGLRAAWRRGEEVFAEVALPEGTDPSAFGLHPALFDASLHAALLAGGDGPAGVPFAWTGVTLHATGATALRVRLAPGDDGTLSLALADTTGAPVATIDSLAVRPIEGRQLRAPARDSLYALHWIPVSDLPTAPETASHAMLDLGADLAALPKEDVPDIVAVTVPDVSAVPGTGDVPSTVHGTTSRALSVLQSWLADEHFSQARLVFVTRGATTGEDLAGAAVWGLVRSAQSENPGRFTLVDLDPDATDAAALPSVLASDEPQLRIRNGQVLAARLGRVTSSADAPGGRDTAEPAPVWPHDGSVLVTGGTGGLGRIVARHLVAEHGVRKLVLAGRRGLAADGAEEFVAGLAERYGAVTAVEACDVADPAAVAELVARHPDITAVVHSAGVLDDGVVQSLDPDRLATVLRPKADAAWHLHEATRRLDLRAFVTFSSAAGTFGTPGQANYAAANAFLDALAVHRRSEGLPATSLAWGPWAQDAGMTGTLSDEGNRRIARGMPELSAEEGVALFDAALATAEAVTLPVRLNLAALRARREVPPLLSGLIRVPNRREVTAGAAVTAGDMARRLSGLSPAEGHEALLEAVRAEIAAVLGHAGTSAVDPAVAFKDLGFDSLTAIELRNRLSTLTGTRLPATLLFDYPSAAELVDHLYARLAPEASASGPELLLSELDRLEAAFGELEITDEVHRRIAGRLDVLRSRWTALHGGTNGAEGDGTRAEFDFVTASDEDVFDLLDNELGLSDDV
ncbi:type I polyketide synthase, partial [Streptomyces tirandamycinicus]|uniref:type I polyketide synthase n=1 Tax=Streptomyces tirandamycinicus TaxID=2174846 RepID=UPI00344A5EC8